MKGSDIESNEDEDMEDDDTGPPQAMWLEITRSRQSKGTNPYQSHPIPKPFSRLRAPESIRKPAFLVLKAHMKWRIAGL